MEHACIQLELLCGGFARSTDAGHIIPRAGSVSRSNGQGACKPSHSWKTAVEDSFFLKHKKVGGGKSLQIKSSETLLPPDTPPRKRKIHEIGVSP
jgi:hypothetical protein